MTANFSMLQLPLADRLSAVMAGYLEQRADMTAEERAGFAALFAWFPKAMPVFEPGWITTETRRHGGLEGKQPSAGIEPPVKIIRQDGGPV